MQNELIKHMVSRFLSWRLPENFNPDDGISFDPIYSRNTKYEGRREPTGTNLFDAVQAEAMVRHMVDGFPMQNEDHALREAVKRVEESVAAINPETYSEPIHHSDKIRTDDLVAVLELAKRAALSATPTTAPIDTEALVEEAVAAIKRICLMGDRLAGDVARAVLALPSIANPGGGQSIDRIELSPVNQANSGGVESALVEEAIAALERIAETPNNGWMIARATLAKLKEGWA